MSLAQLRDEQKKLVSLMTSPAQKNTVWNRDYPNADNSNDTNFRYESDSSTRQLSFVNDPLRVRGKAELRNLATFTASDCNNSARIKEVCKELQCQHPNRVLKSLQEMDTAFSWCVFKELLPSQQAAVISEMDKADKITALRVLGPQKCVNLMHVLSVSSNHSGKDSEKRNALISVSRKLHDDGPPDSNDHGHEDVDRKTDAVFANGQNHFENRTERSFLKEKPLKKDEQHHAIQNQSSNLESLKLAQLSALKNQDSLTLLSMLKEELRLKRTLLSGLKQEYQSVAKFPIQDAISPSSSSSSELKAKDSFTGPQQYSQPHVQIESSDLIQSADDQAPMQSKGLLNSIFSMFYSPQKKESEPSPDTDNTANISTCYQTTLKSALDRRAPDSVDPHISPNPFISERQYGRTEENSPHWVGFSPLTAGRQHVELPSQQHSQRIRSPDRQNVYRSSAASGATNQETGEASRYQHQSPRSKGQVQFDDEATRTVYVTQVKQQLNQLKQQLADQIASKKMRADSRIYETLKHDNNFSEELNTKVDSNLINTISNGVPEVHSTRPVDVKTKHVEGACSDANQTDNVNSQADTRTQDSSTEILKHDFELQDGTSRLWQLQADNVRIPKSNDKDIVSQSSLDSPPKIEYGDGHQNDSSAEFINETGIGEKEFGSFEAAQAKKEALTAQLQALYKKLEVERSNRIEERKRMSIDITTERSPEIADLKDTNVLIELKKEVALDVNDNVTGTLICLTPLPDRIDPAAENLSSFVQIDSKAKQSDAGLAQQEESLTSAICVPLIDITEKNIVFQQDSVLSSEPEDVIERVLQILQKAITQYRLEKDTARSKREPLNLIVEQKFFELARSVGMALTKVNIPIRDDFDELKASTLTPTIMKTPDFAESMQQIEGSSVFDHETKRWRSAYSE